MELNGASPKSGLSVSDSTSDPDEKQISRCKYEDGDCNHKQCRQGTRFKSFVGNSSVQALSRLYSERNKSSVNRFSFRQDDIQSGQTWKNYNIADLNQRIGGNQAQSGEADLVRDRRQESASWGWHDARRGMPNIYNAQGTSWNAFGYVPAVPNFGFYAVRPFGPYAAMGPSLSLSTNIGIQRQRCRDFEERGFCLRGDLCPMQHGVDRIVLGDNQGLSRRDLPVSLPYEQLDGSSEQGALPIISASSCSLMNNVAFKPKSRKRGMTEDGPSMNDGWLGGFTAGGSDAYHLNRHLWINDNPETSVPLRDEAPSTDLQDIPSQAKRRSLDANDSKGKEVCLKQNADSIYNVQEPTYRALRTLFVNRIPLKDNTREALLSHFQKFGVVIDVFIPEHSKRAFIQFLETEAAEAALKAPDAVMNNRFIQVRWANRDIIPDDATNHGLTLEPALSHPFVPYRGKENRHPTGGMEFGIAQLPAYDHPELMVANGPDALHVQQKKLENIELLRKEIRTKQEMLDQKRSEFRRQLDKLEKQAAGSKDEKESDRVTKRLKGEMPPPHTDADISGF